MQMFIVHLCMSIKNDSIEMPTQLNEKLQYFIVNMCGQDYIRIFMNILIEYLLY